MCEWSDAAERSGHVAGSGDHEDERPLTSKQFMASLIEQIEAAEAVAAGADDGALDRRLDAQAEAFEHDQLLRSHAAI